MNSKMIDPGHILELINTEIEQPKPSKKKMLSYLFKTQAFSDTVISKIVENVFKLHPERYMVYLYRGVRNTIQKLYGEITLKEIEKSIIEQCCLLDREQILLEFEGKLKYFENPVLKSRGVALVGTLYVTENRIFVQGRIEGMGGEFSSGSGAKYRIVSRSRTVKGYGYIFPVAYLFHLRRKSSKVVSFKVKNMGGPHKYQYVLIVVSAKSLQRKEIMKKLLEILKHNTVILKR